MFLRYPKPLRVSAACGGNAGLKAVSGRTSAIFDSSLKQYHAYGKTCIHNSAAIL